MFDWRRGGAVGLAMLLVALAACGRSDPEQALRASLADLQQAVEGRDAGRIANHLAEDFIGPGGMDRDGARRMAALHFLRHRQVGVHAPGPVAISLQDAHARVTFTAALTGGERFLPDTGQIYRIESGWRREGADWRMTSIEWRPAVR